MMRIAFWMFAAVVAAGCLSDDSCNVLEATAGATPYEKPLKVAVYADRGPRGIGAAEWYRIVRDSPQMDITLVDAKAVRSGGLVGQDLFIMPGGSSTNEFISLGPDGVARMKEFVRGGGAYLGTCAGCCLLMDGPKLRARMMPWNATGYEPDLFYPFVSLNEKGAKALGLKKGRHQLRYHGGPFMRPTTNCIEGASFELWGTLDSEMTYRGKIKPEKRIHGAAAVLGGTYGKGRVFVTSLHPEYYATTHYFVVAAIRWLTGRTVEIPRPHRRSGDIALGYIVGGITGIGDAEAVLRASSIPGVDFQAINDDDIWVERLAHVDVLAAPGGFGKKTPASTKKAVGKFIARGGRLLTAAPKSTPEGGEACASLEELVRRLEALGK